MNRRLFIRGLVGLGVSAAAAVAYADTLAAASPSKASPAADPGDYYPDTTGVSTTTVTGGEVGSAGAGREGAADPLQVRPRFTG